MGASCRPPITMIISKARRATSFAFAIGLLVASPVFAAMTDLSTPPDNEVSHNSDVDLSDLGVGNFSKFPFHVSASVRGGYDDNVSTSNDFKQESSFIGANLGIAYDFGDARTQITLGAGAGFTFYLDDIKDFTGVTTNDYDINTYISLNLSHKVNARLTLSTVDYLSYSSEPDFTIAQGINRRAGNYFYTNDKFTASYMWTPRFSTATSYTLGILHYDDDFIGMFSNRVENTFGNEFRFALQPATLLVAEYRFQVISYEDNNLDTNTHFVLGGFDHSFNPRFNVSVRAGAQIRQYDEGGDKTAPYFEGTLNYSIAKQTSIAWTNRYAIEEPDIASYQSREVFRTGIQVRHNITDRLTGNLGMYYEHSDYDSAPGVSSFTENAYDLAVSLRYGFTRYLGVEAGYNFTTVWGDVGFREYDRNRVWGGLNFAF